MSSPAIAPLIALPAANHRAANGAQALEDLLSEMMVFLHGTARREGLTLVQIMVIKLLDSRGRLAPSELAELLGISRPAITSCINILEAGGWVVRVHSRGDRRRLETDLRPKARELIARVIRERRAFLDAELTRIDPHRRAQFSSTAAALAEHLRAVLAADEAPRAHRRKP